MPRQRYGEYYLAQLLNYLHISGCKPGFLLNLQGSRVEWERSVSGGG